MNFLPEALPADNIVYGTPYTLEEARLLVGEGGDRILSVAEQMDTAEQYHAGEYLQAAFYTLDELEAAGHPFVTLAELSLHAAREACINTMDPAIDLDRRRTDEEFHASLLKRGALQGWWLGEQALIGASIDEQLRAIDTQTDLDS